MIEVGDVFYNNKGEEYVVSEYVNYKKIRITFTDEHNYSTWITGGEIRPGEIKNPYRPILFDVGYFGEGEHRSKFGSARDGAKQTKEYSTWVNMMSRCYDNNYLTPSIYRDTFVCDEWHNFQVFAEWYVKELEYCKWEGRVYLDKDLIGDGTLYHPDLCCLVPAEINAFCIKNTVGNSSTSVPGISMMKNKRLGDRYFHTAGGYNGILYDTIEEAKDAYFKSKMKRFNFILDEYRDKTHPKVIKAFQEKDFAYLFKH